MVRSNGIVLSTEQQGHPQPRTITPTRHLEADYIGVTVKEQVFHAMLNIFTHGQSKTYSQDPELELELELEVDPELEAEVLEATNVKDESESMSFACKNWCI